MRMDSPRSLERKGNLGCCEAVYKVWDLRFYDIDLTGESYKINLSQHLLFESKINLDWENQYLFTFNTFVTLKRKEKKAAI